MAIGDEANAANPLLWRSERNICIKPTGYYLLPSLFNQSAYSFSFPILGPANLSNSGQIADTTGYDSARAKVPKCLVNAVVFVMSRRRIAKLCSGKVFA